VDPADGRFQIPARTRTLREIIHTLELLDERRLLAIQRTLRAMQRD
jgi:hypothetical protein